MDTEFSDTDDKPARRSPPTRPLVAILEQLHSTPPTFDDESCAPEVDRDWLVSLFDQELHEGKARLVYRLIYSFKSWYDAHTEVLIEQFRSRRQ
jgi:hypothetical protein